MKNKMTFTVGWNNGKNVRKFSNNWNKTNSYYNGIRFFKKKLPIV